MTSKQFFERVLLHGVEIVIQESRIDELVKLVAVDGLLFEGGALGAPEERFNKIMAGEIEPVREDYRLFTMPFRDVFNRFMEIKDTLTLKMEIDENKHVVGLHFNKGEEPRYYSSNLSLAIFDAVVMYGKRE